MKTLETATAADDEAEAGEATSPLPHLFLVLEGTRPGAGGARFALSGVDEVVIGRGAARGGGREVCGGRTRLHVSVPAPTLSTLHARLCNHRGHWSLQDLGSTNGTWLNGSRASEAVLRDGDVIEAGHAWFVFREALSTPRSSLGDADSGSIVAGRGLRTLLPLEQERLRTLTTLARAQLPILLLGETGTGKELLARAVHQQSGRSGELVAVNSGALTPSLLESQLFGHVRGAFSGALRDEPGLVRAAERGTLFLDEIGDMPAPAQVALLRVLQQREVMPVGAARPVPVDVRVVAATHRPLHELASTGQFRADLLARLHGHVHQLPPLRNRREDFGLLLGDVLAEVDAEQHIRRISPEAARLLIMHRWPLNLRQLAQTLSRAAALVDDGVLRARHVEGPLAELAQRAEAPAGGGRARELTADERALRDRLVGLLREQHGNVTEVARSMGKARMQVQRWMKRFGVDPAVYRSRTPPPVSRAP